MNGEQTDFALETLFPKTPGLREITIKDSGERLVFNGFIPDEIFAMAAKCELLKESGDELVVFDFVDVLLAQCTATSESSFR